MVKLGKTLFFCFHTLPRYVFYNLIKQKKKCHFVYLILFIAFVVEVLSYYYVPLLWKQIECIDRKKCTRILLVADPQLIGLRNEQIHALTPVAIWDSDRYLSKTYGHAYKFTNPDVVIFLGDLLDEGSIAINKEYQSYVERFYNIFPTNNIQHIWIPGDNDIGGDYADYITRHKIERFNKAFPQKDVTVFKNIRFNNVNTLVNHAPTLKWSEVKNYTNVVLSHLNLLVIPTLFVEKVNISQLLLHLYLIQEKHVLDTLYPKVVFSAHSHKAMVIVMDDESRDRVITRVHYNDTRIYSYDLNDNNIVEMVVPTCSYRMGTDKIGYGFAVLESNALKYTILWTPSRFFQLKVHGVLCIILTFYYLLRCCCSCKKAEIAQYSVLENVA